MFASTWVPIVVFWLLLVEAEVRVNLCVLRCKDNHMREMENEWSPDFTLPLLSLLRTTRNETAAFIKAQEICQSNLLLEECLKTCNQSQEAMILQAGVKSWQDACSNLDEVRAQFPCWKENGDELSNVCRLQTLRLEQSLHTFARNQSQENIDTICADYEHFSTCFTQEHGKYCGYRSEVITGRMFDNNRDAMLKMLKIRWSSLPSSCKYTQLRRDTYSAERFQDSASSRSTNYAVLSAHFLFTCLALLDSTWYARDL